MNDVLLLRCFMSPTQYCSWIPIVWIPMVSWFSQVHATYHLTLCSLAYHGSLRYMGAKIQETRAGVTRRGGYGP
jgi:hypothetical protein